MNGGDVIRDPERAEPRSSSDLPRHWRAAVVAALCGGLAVIIVSCSGGSSPKKSTTTTTSRVTIPVTTAAGAPATVATTTPATSLAPGQTATSVAGPPATTTPGGRVVTSPSDNVRLGDSGAGVRQIQTALAAKGYKVSVDGKFGAQTSLAVKAFQKANGLSADGVVGPATWAKLQGSSSPATTVKGTTTTVKPTTTTAHH